MPKVVIRNILTVTEGMVVQQVNCRGVMGKGLALQVRNLFPEVYASYMNKYRREGWKVGDAQFVAVSPTLMVANLAGQDDWRGSGVKTDYSGLKVALVAANSEAKSRGIQLYIPFGLGAGLAGGDWNLISGIIDECAADSIVCKLAG